MTYDAPTRTRDYRGTLMREGRPVAVRTHAHGTEPAALTLTTVDAAAALLAQLVVRWPVGAEVEHTGTGRTGRVSLDDPATIPGLHTGRPSAVCLSPRGDLVCVKVVDGLSALTWVPAERLRRTGRR
ncbi:hypothetical protein [Streptomyces synnematoformans]|uniref:Uncharacterized protein n=1 Tax=Streptomyces synnematoformans TaxID=415721 RepID=A0ABN2XAE2_9ACTN